MKKVTRIESAVANVTTELFGEEFISAFIASRHISENSQRAYHNALNSIIRYFGANNISAPSSVDIDSYIENLRVQKKSASTIKQYFAVAKLFFSYCERRGICANVTAEVKLRIRKSSKHLKKSLSDKQAVALLNAIKGNDEISLRNRAIVALSLSSGVRQCELSRANIGSLEILDDNRVILNVFGKGRDAEDDAVVIPAQIFSIINEYFVARGVEIGEDDDMPLFASKSNRNGGERLSTQSIGKLISGLIRKTLGIRDKRVTGHSTRHYFATSAILEGIDIREVSSALRHKSLDVTLVYLNDLNIKTRRAENTVASRLFNAA